MIKIRKSEDRGYVDHGWLKSFHSFSFGEYRDPDHMHFGPLRVINEDFIEANSGFDRHGHKNMEIITYVLSGEITHLDSIGNKNVVRAGMMQRMSAGSGVMHSEFNFAKKEEARILQIWIMPDVMGIAPSYEEKKISRFVKEGCLSLILSQGEDGVLHLHQDARVYLGLFDGKETAELPIEEGRLVYAHVIDGRVSMNSHYLTQGDALLLSEEKMLKISGAEKAHLLVFDLPSETV
jgi:redox-sensitive bicupin YhaK (pirin superfamily)